MPSTIDQVQNFIEYTIVAPSGTGISAGIDVTVIEDITSFPTASVSDPVTILAFDPNNEAATRELIEVTNKNNSLHTLRWATRGVDGSLPVDHLNNQKIRIVLNRRIILQMKTAILALESAVSALQSALAPTVSILTGEVYSATTTDPNGSGSGLSVTGPTLLQMLPTGAVRADGNVASQGNLDRLAVAAEPSGGSGQTKLAYMPNRVISGFTGLIPFERYYNSAAVAGAWSRTIGPYWRLCGMALSATTMFVFVGHSSIYHGTPGTAGTALFNVGVSNLLARADHEHRVINLVPWATPDPVALGDKQIYLTNTWGYNVEITRCILLTKAPGSGVSIANVYYKTLSQVIANTGTWTSIFATRPQLAAGVYGAENGVFTGGATNPWTPDVVLKFEMDQIASGLGQCMLQLTVKAKNTN